LDFLHRKHGYPVDIVIKMKDSSEFSLKSAMKLTIKQTTYGTQTTRTIYKDRYILAYDKNGTTKYYTAFSNDATEYIIEDCLQDFITEDARIEDAAATGM